MQYPIVLAIEYGAYVSIIKLFVFCLFFYGSLALINWVYKDAGLIGSDEHLWTAVTAGTIMLCTLLWWLLPIFILGMVIFILATGTAGLLYVKHRNGRVMEYQRVLTPQHIRQLISSGSKEGGEASFVFFTANSNEVPPPEPKTPDFFGYRTAYDMFREALRRRVETMKFSPGNETYRISYEIDGAVMPQPEMPREQAEYFIRFAKQLAGLDIKEKRKPQKGRFRIYQGKDYFEWEVKTAGSTVGEQVVIRYQVKDKDLRLNTIGFSSKQLEQLKVLQQIKQGMFIISGPKGSGLTTSFYAFLRDHDAYVNSIHTLEKEPSASLPSVTQQVYSLSDTATQTYAKKLQEIMRMGANIVGVTECHDPETAKVICEGAADGKLVYIVLEAESVLQAIGRWLKLVGDRKLATADLVGVSCQRLLRMLCEECKQGYTPNQDILKKFNLPADKAKVLYRPGKVIYDKRGKEHTCEHCQGTGFVGRTGVLEMILLNDELRTVIQQAKALPEMGAHFRRAKMLYLQEQALRKVMAGTTAINEMVRVLSSAQKTKTRKST